MGRRGPLPTKRATQELRGNPRRQKRRAKARPKIAANGALSPPVWLGSVARAEWKRVAGSINDFRGIDSASLACYCQAVEDLQAALELIAKQGRTFTTDKGYVGVHPAVGMANNAAERIKKFSSEFGFTPAARARMEPDEGPPDRDPLEEFLPAASPIKENQ